MFNIIGMVRPLMCPQKPHNNVYYVGYDQCKHSVNGNVTCYVILFLQQSNVTR